MHFSAERSSISWSIVKPGGGSLPATQPVMAEDGDRAVLSRLAGKPSTRHLGCSRNSSALACAASITNQPLIGSIQPNVVRRRMNAGHQFLVRASHRSRNSLRPTRRPSASSMVLISGQLPDDRRRQQALLNTERDQPLSIDGVNQSAAARGATHPTHWGSVGPQGCRADFASDSSRASLLPSRLRGSR